jgi:hypothetical protein
MSAERPTSAASTPFDAMGLLARPDQHDIVAQSRLPESVIAAGAR